MNRFILLFFLVGTTSLVMKIFLHPTSPCNSVIGGAVVVHDRDITLRLLRP